VGEDARVGNERDLGSGSALGGRVGKGSGDDEGDDKGSSGEWVAVAVAVAERHRKDCG
jgi:hypothetical protein